METTLLQSDISENEKVSYWLEKLHNQQGEKISPLSTENQDEEVFKEEEKYKLIKDQAAKKDEDRQIVSDLIAKSNRCIISISSLFPWDFFPNTINVEESRVTFTFRQFLASQSRSVEIKDISSVFIESSLFFATIQVISNNYVENEIKVSYLNRKKAYVVHRVIEGLRIFKEHHINTSNYEIDELVAKTEEFRIN